MPHPLPWRFTALLLAIGVSGCAKESGSSAQDAAVAAQKDSGAHGGTSDAGGASADAGDGAHDAATSELDAAMGPDAQNGGGETDAASNGDGGAGDAGTASDAAMLDGALTQGAGSCCSERDTPGCSNADLEVCVCEKLPTCCTEQWGLACTLIVEQKWCQPGVRECVCGTGDGQWAQTTCCEDSWTENFCDTVAEAKCGAIPGCR